MVKDRVLDVMDMEGGMEEEAMEASGVKEKALAMAMAKETNKNRITLEFLNMAAKHF